LYLKLLKKYGRDDLKFMPYFEKTKTLAQVRNYWMNNKVRGVGLVKKMEKWEKEKKKNGFKVVRHYQGKVLRCS